mgnify:CR=1 FL=1
MLGRAFVRFISLMIEENSNAQISFSVVLGMCLGLFPSYSLQWVFCLCLGMLFRFNIFTVLGSSICFFLLRSTIEAPLHDAGLIILTSLPSLFPLWRWMYHAPIFPYSSFNHTVDAASTLLAIALIPLVWCTCYFVIRHLRDRILYYWRSTKLFRTYASYRYLSK